MFIFFEEWRKLSLAIMHKRYRLSPKPWRLAQRPIKEMPRHGLIMFQIGRAVSLLKRFGI